MSQPPIEYYQPYDNTRSEAESPATLQDSRIGESYSVARMDGLPQTTTDYLTSTNTIATSCESGSIMQNASIIGVDQKPNINTALAVAMLHSNGDMSIENNHLMGIIDNQSSAAAAAAAAVAAASSVQPQIHQNTLQPLAKPMALRSSQPASSEALLQSQRAYVQQAAASLPSSLQASPMNVITPSIHGPGTSGSPPQHTTLQMSTPIPQATGIDNTSVHGVMDDSVVMSGGVSNGGNQMAATNNGSGVMPMSMPTSVMKVLSGTSQQRPRSEKKPIPEDLKDDKYFERRKRNNMAAKKSRDARKQREDEIAIRASFLEKENAILRAQVATLRDEANSLRQLLLAKRTTTRN